MCGIIFQITDKIINIDNLKKAETFQKHRGPDFSGSKNIMAETKNLYFSHQRLSILDLSSAANQPMIDEETGSILIFNGEVYVSDFDINSIPDTLQPSWDFFKKNSDKLIECFNPVYDLFAGYVLSGAIQGEDWSTHSPEEFLKNVVQEF